MSGPLALVLGLAAGSTWAWWAARRLRRAAQLLQLEEYDNRRALRWAARHWAGDYAPISYLAAFVLVLALTGAVLEDAAPFAIACSALFVALGVATPLTVPLPVEKKPLNMTARVRRLFGALAAVLVLLAVALLAGGWLLGLDGRDAVLAGPLLAWLCVAGAPQLLTLANLLARPVEASLRRRFRNEAIARLRAVSPRIVAITGSAGKTTTKELTAAILESRYRVLKTPRSFNTVMGITRVIREELRDDHEVFVVEMGAYHEGEIRDLCRFVGGPDVSAIVTINEQHLERMGTIENTVRAKYEIVQGCRPGGAAVFNVDNPHCARLAAQTENVRVLRVSATGAGDVADLWADNVSVTPRVMRFDVHDGEQTLTVRTRLIGRHLLPNLLIALAIGREMGVELSAAVARLGRVAPVEHRLAISEVDGTIVIDDAYSSNVEGARAALDLLAELPAERRIMVTPGIVELGSVEEERNRAFGAQAATVCDTLLVVGSSPGRFVAEGALAAGMARERVLSVANLAAAQAHLRDHTRRGDAVLFENDLPDIYT